MAGPANRTPKFQRMGFTPDGKTLAAILCLEEPSAACLVCYDTQTQKEVARIEPKLLFTHFAYAPDGKAILVRSYAPAKKGDNELRNLVELRDARTLKPKYSLNLATEEARDILVTPDGKTVVCPGKGHVLLIDLASGKPRAKFATLGPFESGDAVISPDGKLLALADAHTERVVVYDLARGRPVADIPADSERPRSGNPKVCFSPDSERLARDDRWSRELLVYQARGGKILSRDRTGLNSSPALLRFTKDGKAVIYAAGPTCDPGIEAFCLERKEFVRPAHLKRLYGANLAAVSADGSFAAISRGEAEIRIFRIDTKKDK